MTSGVMEIINGIVIFCFAFLLLLLISFSNFIFGILIIPFSLGLVERDGVLIIVGYIEAIIYINFVYLLIATTIKTFFVFKDIRRQQSHIQLSLPAFRLPQHPQCIFQSKLSPKARISKFYFLSN